MRSFFSQNVSDYVTPVSSDSLSPFPTEYDATNEKEMKFLTLSSLDTRGDPQYEDVFNHLKLSFPPFIVTFFAPISWSFDHGPLCWVGSFVKDLILATRVSVVLRPIASNEEVLRNPHIAKEIDRLSSPDTPNAEPRESVLKRARKIIGTGVSCVIEIDMTNDVAADEGMVCGGTMRVLIEDASENRA